MVSKVTRICPLDLTEMFSIHVSFGNCQVTLVVMGGEGGVVDETSASIDASRKTQTAWWVGIFFIRGTNLRHARVGRVSIYDLNLKLVYAST